MTGESKGTVFVDVPLGSILISIERSHRESWTIEAAWIGASGELYSALSRNTPDRSVGATLLEAFERARELSD